MKKNKFQSMIVFILLTISVFIMLNNESVKSDSGLTTKSSQLNDSGITTKTSQLELDDSSGTVFLINSTYSNVNFTSGNGMNGTPWIIDGLHPTPDGNKDLLTIMNNHSFFKIINGNFSFGYNGIVIENSNNTMIESNVIHNNMEHGITFIDSYESTIENNFIYNNGMGDGCVFNLNLNQVKLNAHMGGGVHYEPSGNSLITNNTIYGNYVAGIILEDAINVEITGNNITANGRDCVPHSASQVNLAHRNDINPKGTGILIEKGSNVIIHYNHIENNFDNGILILENGEENQVEFNNFIDNGDAAQAYDLGTNNTFNCNYWGKAEDSHSFPEGKQDDNPSQIKFDHLIGTDNAFNCGSSDGDGILSIPLTSIFLGIGVITLIVKKRVT